jgi:hypothetical protein
MRLAVLRAIVWPFTGLGLAALGAAVFAPVATSLPAAPPREAAHAAKLTVVRPNLDSVARVVTERDLFRPSRRPAPISAVPSPASPVPVVPRPTLTLVGLVAGAQPSAVIEGFPGTQGPRVVRPGDVIGPLTIRRISAAAVEITGMDTTWVLTVRKLWD